MRSLPSAEATLSQWNGLDALTKRLLSGRYELYGAAERAQLLPILNLARGDTVTLTSAVQSHMRMTSSRLVGSAEMEGMATAAERRAMNALLRPSIALQFKLRITDKM